MPVGLGRGNHGADQRGAQAMLLLRRARVERRAGRGKLRLMSGLCADRRAGWRRGGHGGRGRLRRRRSGGGGLVCLPVAIGLVGQAADQGEAAGLERGLGEFLRLLAAEQQSGEPAGERAGGKRAGGVGDPFHAVGDRQRLERVRARLRRLRAGCGLRVGRLLAEKLVEKGFCVDHRRRLQCGTRSRGHILQKSR